MSPSQLWLSHTHWRALDCDKLFKLLNIVFDVLFKLLIDNVELVDKLFKFVVNANTDGEDILDKIEVVVNCVELS